jgi:proline iminopeptidase
MFLPLDNHARLYYHTTGQGHPIVVLHGGPDFDHTYLLPDLDRLLFPSFHLIFYDQRGRGRSADNVQPEDVTIQSEVEDLERLRSHLNLDSFVLLGHSWGTLLALEYAIRHPHRVSHLILLNTAPVSHDDFLFLRQELPKKRAPGDIEMMQAIAATPGYKAGDPDTVARYYRIHYSPTIRQPELLDRLIAALRASFTPEGVLKARAIEDRLMEQIWFRSDYDLLPALQHLAIPTLVLHGDYDFIPSECAAHIAQSIPNARFVTLPNCGHFSYLEHPDEVRQAIVDFFQGP